MSLDAPKPATIHQAAAFRFGIVAARYNASLIDTLLANVTRTLHASGAQAVVAHRVPGSHELPSAAQWMIESAAAAGSPFDALIALGVIIRGDTIHYELVSKAATDGLLQVALKTGRPVIAGVIATENRSQAEARCAGTINRGAEFAQAAIEMAALRRTLFQS